MTEILDSTFVNAEILRSEFGAENDIPQINRCFAFGTRIREKYRNFSESHPIVATATETIGVIAVDTMAYSLFQQNATDHMSGLLSARNTNPNLFDLETVTLVPVVEELRYRSASWLAAILLPTSRGFQRSIDSVSAYKFAEVHRSGEDSFALPEFLGGLHLARLARSRGIGHAIFSHALFNSSFVLSARFNK